jgi:hypothetical protein
MLGIIASSEHETDVNSMGLFHIRVFMRSFQEAYQMDAWQRGLIFPLSFRMVCVRH